MPHCKVCGYYYKTQTQIITHRKKAEMTHMLISSYKLKQIESITINGHTYDNLDVVEV